MEDRTAQMCHDLIMLLHRIKTALMSVAEEYDMTPVQFGALYSIMEGHSTTGQLAHKLHCDASNATGIVDRLVAQRLVVRIESEQDRRIKTLQLTAKGKQIIEDAIAKLPKAIGCDNLSIKELDAMHAAVGKLTAM